MKVIDVTVKFTVLVGDTASLPIVAVDLQNSLGNAVSKWAEAPARMVDRPPVVDFLLRAKE